MLQPVLKLSSLWSKVKRIEVLVAGVKPSAEIESILGYVDESELIHRDNMVLLG